MAPCRFREGCQARQITQQQRCRVNERTGIIGDNKAITRRRMNPVISNRCRDICVVEMAPTSVLTLRRLSLPRRQKFSQTRFG